jgi:hypothetical protein
MLKLTPILGIAALFVGQAAAACRRDMLEYTANKFIESAKVDGTNFDISPAGIAYTENYKDVPLDKGVYSKAIRVSHTHTLIDAPGCAIYVEIIAPNNQPGFHLATQLFVNEDGGVKKVEVVVTSSDALPRSWYYNGQKAVQVIESEERAGQRAVIPENRRATREHLKEVADSYLNLFNAKGAGGAQRAPNFSKGCVRHEGKSLIIAALLSIKTYLY